MRCLFIQKNVKGTKTRVGRQRITSKLTKLIEYIRKVCWFEVRHCYNIVTETGDGNSDKDLL